MDTKEMVARIYDTLFKNTDYDQFPLHEISEQSLDLDTKEITFFIEDKRYLITVTETV